jgi:hypothetical protein
MRDHSQPVYHHPNLKSYKKSLTFSVYCGNGPGMKILGFGILVPLVSSFVMGRKVSCISKFFLRLNSVIIIISYQVLGCCLVTFLFVLDRPSFLGASELLFIIFHLPFFAHYHCISYNLCSLFVVSMFNALICSLFILCIRLHPLKAHKNFISQLQC